MKATVKRTMLAMAIATASTAAAANGPSAATGADSARNGR